MCNEELCYSRPFFDLFYDAIVFADLSKKEAELQRSDSIEESYARASIIDSILCLECAANCCLESLPQAGGFKDDLDKLPFISKFEVYLGLMLNGKKLDRGVKVVQDVQELKSVRDSYVHPKVKKAKWRQLNESVRTADFGATPRLQIPRTIDVWEASDAVTVLKASSAFIDHFFIDLCGFNPHTTCELLMSTGKAEIPASVGLDVSGIKEFGYARREWGIPLRFLGNL